METHAEVRWHMLWWVIWSEEGGLGRDLKSTRRELVSIWFHNCLKLLWDFIKIISQATGRKVKKSIVWPRRCCKLIECSCCPITGRDRYQWKISRNLIWLSGWTVITFRLFGGIRVYSTVIIELFCSAITILKAIKLSMIRFSTNVKRILSSAISRLQQAVKSCWMSWWRGSESSLWRECDKFSMILWKFHQRRDKI